MINKLKNLFRAVRKNRTVKQIETSGDPQVSEIVRLLELIDNKPSIFEKKDNKIKCLENEIENQNKLIKRQETEIETLKKMEQLSRRAVSKLNEKLKNDN